MSPLSPISKLVQFREALAQLNSEFFMTISERRSLCIKIQELKEPKRPYSNYDPEREKELFDLQSEQLRELSLKELLAFSLIMEDQAQAFAPGSYPSWSQLIHLSKEVSGVLEMINPLLLKISHPDLFSKLALNDEFDFLKHF